MSNEQLGIGAELFRLSVGNGVLDVPDGPENDCSSAHNRAVGRPALWPPKSWQHSIYFRFLVANLKTSALTLFGTVKTVPYRTFYTVLLSHQIVVERDALIPPWKNLNNRPQLKKRSLFPQFLPHLLKTSNPSGLSHAHPAQMHPSKSV